MKVKFEIKSDENSIYPLFTIFMEHRGKDQIEMLITRFNLQQLELPNKNPVAQKSDIPITDGILSMSKPNLKKFIAALQLLAKS